MLSAPQTASEISLEKKLSSKHKEFIKFFAHQNTKQSNGEKVQEFANFVSKGW